MQEGPACVTSNSSHALRPNAADGVGSHVPKCPNLCPLGTRRLPPAPLPPRFAASLPEVRLPPRRSSPRPGGGPSAAAPPGHSPASPPAAGSGVCPAPGPDARVARASVVQTKRLRMMVGQTKDKASPSLDAVQVPCCTLTLLGVFGKVALCDLA